jgi:uncharacterized delta-60 repeat protein
VYGVGSAGRGSRRADFALARYTKTGALDPSFGAGGKVLTKFGCDCLDVAAAVAIQKDGNIVAAGSSEPVGSSGGNFALARYTKSGALDGSFGTSGRVLTSHPAYDFSLAGAVAIQEDGKIIAAGYGSTDEDRNRNFTFARFKRNGTLDPTFGFAGWLLNQHGDAAEAIAIQENGKIVAAGSRQHSWPVGPSDFALVRLLKATGKGDDSFNPHGSGACCGGVQTDFGSESDDEAHAVAIQDNGRIVAVGSSDAGGSVDFALARYTR